MVHCSERVRSVCDLFQLEEDEIVLCRERQGRARGPLQREGGWSTAARRRDGRVVCCRKRRGGPVF